MVQNVGSNCGWISPISLTVMVVILWTFDGSHAHTKVNDVSGGIPGGGEWEFAPAQHQHQHRTGVPLLNVSGVLEVHSIRGLYTNCNQSEMNIWFLETCMHYFYGIKDSKGRQRRWITALNENDDDDDAAAAAAADDNPVDINDYTDVIFRSQKRNVNNVFAKINKSEIQARIEKAQSKMNDCCKPGKHCTKENLVKEFRDVCRESQLKVGTILRS